MTLIPATNHQSPYHNLRWSLRLLRRELVELRREHSHLMRLRAERALSPWEQSRIAEMPQETKQVINSLREYNRLSLSDIH